MTARLTYWGAQLAVNGLLVREHAVDALPTFDPAEDLLPNVLLDSLVDAEAFIASVLS